MTRDPVLRNFIVVVIMHIITKQEQKKKLKRINARNGSYLWISLWETTTFGSTTAFFEHNVIFQTAFWTQRILLLG